MARTITVRKRETKDEEENLFAIKINGRFILNLHETSEARVWKKIEKAIKEIK